MFLKVRAQVEKDDYLQVFRYQLEQKGKSMTNQ